MRIVRGVFALALVVAVVAGSYALFRFVYTTPLLEVRDVQVQGTRVLSRDEAVALLGLTGRQNLVAWKPEEAQRRLLRHPWVRDAILTKRFPNGVTVQVREREAAAVVEGVGRGYLVDREGYVLAVAGSPDGTSLPKIEGIHLGGQDLEPGRLLVSPRLALALQALEAVTSSPLAQALTDLRLEVEEGQRVLLRAEGVQWPLLLAAGRLPKQLETYGWIEPVLYRHDDPSTVEQIDLSYPDKVIVRKVPRERVGGTDG